MYKKNKEKFFVSLVLLLSVLVPQISLASVISLRSSSTKVEPTKTFTLSIYADPKSVASYTAQANIKFPSDLVSIESFTYNSAWLPLTPAGYDLIDNTAGKLIKTAGYPNGFSTETLLGTAVFKSKKAGTAIISTEKESYILDIDSNNTLSTYGSFSITAGAPVVTPPPATTPPPVTKTPDTKTPVIKTPVTKEITTQTTTANTTSKNIKTNNERTQITKYEIVQISEEEIVDTINTILESSNIAKESKDETTKASQISEVLEAQKQKIVDLVYKDTNKDGISDYDSKYIYKIDPIKVSHISKYEGKNINASEKILLGFDPTKEELIQIKKEEPISSKASVVENYKVNTIVFDSKKVSIKGQALPNSFITIYIYSTPIMVTIKTDNKGEWEYILDKELEDGNHTIYTATVNNTGNIIAKSSPYTFVKTAEAVTLQDSPVVGSMTTVEKPGMFNYKNIFIVLITLLMAVGISLILIGLLGKKNNQV